MKELNMEKRMKKLSVLLMVIAVLLSGWMCAVVALTLLTKRAHSVSIIGGADGPTSIFLAGKVNPWSLIIGIVAGLMLLTAGIVLIRKRK